MRLASDQQGQALVLSAVFLTVLLGMAAVAIDVGTWFQADRAAQATADAAALAAAQELPAHPSSSKALAEQYATKNGGGLKTVAFGSAAAPNDTVTVEVERPSAGFFSQVVGVDSVTVAAKASARASQLGAAKLRRADRCRRAPPAHRRRGLPLLRSGHRARAEQGRAGWDSA